MGGAESGVGIPLNFFGGPLGLSEIGLPKKYKTLHPYPGLRSGHLNDL